MYFLRLTLIILALALSLPLRADADEQASQFDEAHRLVEAGNYDEALPILTTLHDDAPTDLTIGLEMGYVLTKLGRHDDVLRLTREMERAGVSSDLLYQMRGNALDYLGKRGEAVRTYRAGLAKYPQSGALYQEMGNIFLASQEYENALANYERGMEAEPDYPSNYYCAAILLLNSSEPVMGLIYAEILRVLEPRSERSAELGRLLFECYRDNIRREPDGVVLSLTNSADDFRTSYEDAVKSHQPTMRRVYSGGSLSLLDIVRLKMHLLDVLADDEWGGVAQRLLDYEQQVRRAGHFYAYCMWLMRTGDTAEFEEWMTLHERDMEAFAVWYGENGIDSIKQ